jgi:hypothetical protein
MPKTITYSGVLTVLDCGACHISFAIPRDMLTARQADGRDFWCPNGCKIHYFETENAKLKAKLEREQRWRKDAETSARAAYDQAQAAEGHVTRIKRRVGNGVCPCCNRHFANVERHMNSQHPGYQDTE